MAGFRLSGPPSLLAEVDLEMQAVSCVHECPFAVQSLVKVREVEERNVDRLTVQLEAQISERLERLGQRGRSVRS